MSPFSFHKDFQINGNSFSSVSELISYSKQLYPLNSFLKDWFSKSDSIIVQTSGSTGKPKSIRLRKEFMINSAKATARYFDLPASTSALCCLPIDFIAGKMMVVRAITLGWHLDIIEPTSNPLKTIGKSYDFCAMVPLQVSNSMAKLNFIKKLIIGGGEVSKSLEDDLQKVTTKAFATYGMTETITHIAVQQLNHLSFRAQSSNLYNILPNISISQDNRGCLIINAPKISDELIITNDVVELISDTEFIWKGRYDHVINSGGIKLHPEVIEKKLANLISQRFFVAGVKDESLGEKLVLCVEGKTNEHLLKSISNKVDFSNKYEIPKEVFFVKEFLETETGKIKRKETLQSILP